MLNPFFNVSNSIYLVYILAGRFPSQVLTSDHSSEKDKTKGNKYQQCIVQLLYCQFIIIDNSVFILSSQNQMVDPMNIIIDIYIS